jgi:predicted TIM-barrel fold metal-dependent hydrolase
MIPDHWYPWEPRFFQLYEKIQQLGVPVLFHSGILFGFKDSSRFCMPCNYEVLINFPKLKFALAHVSWPWTDECIALFGRFRANLRRSLSLGDERAKEMQMYIDITSGTPKFYRREVLRKALAYGCEDHMIFGSDSTASNFMNAKYVAEMDKGIIRELGYSDEVIKKIQSKNVERFLKR